MARVTLREITRIVSDEYGVSLQDMIGPRRFKHIVEARRAVFWLAQRYTTLSGAMVSSGLRKDHTTGLHAVKKTERVGLPEEGQRAEARIREIAERDDEIAVEARIVLKQPIPVPPAQHVEKAPEPPPLPPPPPAPVMRVVPPPTKRVTIYRKPLERPRVVTGAIFGDPGHASPRIARGERSANR